MTKIALAHEVDINFEYLLFCFVLFFVLLFITALRNVLLVMQKRNKFIVSTGLKLISSKFVLSLILSPNYDENNSKPEENSNSKQLETILCWVYGSKC